MRSIDLDDLGPQIPERWTTLAEGGASAIRTEYEMLFLGATTPEPLDDKDPRRQSLSAKVKAQQKVWQDDDLKELMMAASHGKCWYCEAQIQQRSDGAIDHYRPKNRIAETKQHHGYFWLACDWRNYRFACTFCNSARNTDETKGGKQDHFKLWEEKNRAGHWTHPLNKEQPLLLDPCEPADIGQITFEPNEGKPVPAFPKGTDPYRFERAAESIERYHLHRPKYNQLRRTLMADVIRLIKEADEFLTDGDDRRADSAYKQKFRDLRNKIKPTAEFSAAARAAIAMHRGTSETARQLIDFF